MNVFATNTSGCRTVAQQTISDRIDDAQRRAVVRALRAERRAARRAERRVAQASFEVSAQRLPTWAFRFLHPVH
jgi:hypothetical protein